MKMISVKSSNVQKIGYEAGELHVLYKTGLYRWLDVEPQDHEDLMKAESKGSHLRSVIEAKYGKGSLLSKHEGTEGRIGYLVETTRTEQPNNKINLNTPEAHCPACQREAQGFIPPMSDSRYADRVQIEKELNNLESAEEAHKSFLKASGGYIEICQCGVSFFVPARLAKLKAS